MSVYLSICLSICLSVCLFVCLSVCPFACLCVCLSPSVYLFVYFSVHFSVSLFICLFTCWSISLSSSTHHPSCLTGLGVKQKFERASSLVNSFVASFRISTYSARSSSSLFPYTQKVVTITIVCRMPIQHYIYTIPPIVSQTPSRRLRLSLTCSCLDPMWVVYDIRMVALWASPYARRHPMPKEVEQTVRCDAWVW